MYRSYTTRMDVSGKVAIVTGGGSGIGAALAHVLAAAGARVVVADLDGAAASLVASTASGSAVGVATDVADDASLRALLARTEADLGPVDLFCANAGVLTPTALETSDAGWAQALDVNLMAHVRAARLLVPRWTARAEGGCFVATASAAGLLTQIGSPAYAVSKHAAVAFAEWLSVTYGDQGVRVSCICPMGVSTAMLDNGSDAVVGAIVAAGAVVEARDVALATLAAIEEERFLVLPHPEVLEYFRRKGSDYERWLAGMRRLQAGVSAGA